MPEVEKKVLGFCGRQYGSSDMPVIFIYRCPNGYSLIRRCCDAPNVYLNSAGEFIGESCGQLPPGPLYDIRQNKCDIANRTIVPKGQECSPVNLCTGKEGERESEMFPDPDFNQLRP